MFHQRTLVLLGCALTVTCLLQSPRRTNGQGSSVASTSLGPFVMTEKYSELSVEMPVFGELRNCMDLAVVAALITHHGFVKRVDTELPSLTGSNGIRGPKYHVPTTVDAHISVAHAGREWIVGVSGGVDLDSWSVLNTQEIGHVSWRKPRPERGSWWWE